MATFPGLYRAKAVKIETAAVTVQIPQVYGEAGVIVTEFVGARPTAVGMGWVTFRSGDPAFPVWHGETGGGGGGEATNGLPAGGTAGQALTKIDATDYNAQWATLSGGGGGALAYVHNQSTSASTWTIDHGLTFRPNVTVVDSAGDAVDGNITYPLITRVVLTFSAAFSGIAYLS